MYGVQYGYSPVSLQIVQILPLLLNISVERNAYDSYENFCGSITVELTTYG